MFSIPIRAAFCLVATILWTGCAPFAPHHAKERVYPNVLFASPGGHDLSMDLYVPDFPKPAPVVIWIFGGSWRIGNKGYHVNLRDLTKYGIAVAAIQYRLSNTATYPAQIEDCEAAAQWLRTRGAHYGIDPRQIAASGESAGGHLAALLGAIEGKARIRAVCALYPPTDLVSLGRQYANPNHASDVERLLGGPIAKKLSLAAEASPVNRVRADSPPFLIIHGADDTLVPVEQSRELHRRLRSLGVESRLEIIPGEPHWFLLSSAQVAEVARFFQAHFSKSLADKANILRSQNSVE